MMDKFKRLFNKAKWLKKAGILTLVLTMLLTLFNNGVLIKADDNVNANINFTSQIVEQINGSYVSISDVQSGKSFFLAIGYTISASGETSRYTNCTLSITLPSYVSFSGQTSDIQGTAFDEINYNINFEGTPYEERTLTITADELVPGQTGTLYLQMSFDNLKTPDGSVANFTGMTLTGSVVAGDSSPNFNEILVPEATVIATASQDWTVSKDVAKQNNNDYSIETIDGKKYYSVDYRITAAPGKNISDIGNNYGRLNCTFVDEQGNKADGFMLVDTLPVAPVANGGAYNIEVYAGTTKSSENMLQEGEDYELVLNDDGSVKAIRIKYVSTYSDIKNDYTTAYVPDDAHVLTTYTINANYDYNAYRVLPVDEDKIPYLLDNKAEIKYLPVGESTYKTTNDNASVNVGWVDGNKITHSFGDSQRNYQVYYKQLVSDETTPQPLQVNYVDLATGNILEIHEYTVDPGKNKTITLDSSFDYDGTTYILNSAQQDYVEGNKITHKFGHNITEYNVYYTEKGVEINSYEVSITYMDVSHTNVGEKTLYTTKVTANVNEALSIDVEQQFQANGTTYVLLPGQESHYDHDFYSTRRNYVMVYRDINDTNNDIVLNPIVANNTSEMAVTLQGTNANGTAITIEGTTGNPIMNNPDGNIVPYQEEETEIIEEEQTPLVNGKENQVNNSNETLFIAGGIVLVIIIAGLIYGIKTKKLIKFKNHS